MNDDSTVSWKHNSPEATRDPELLKKVLDVLGAFMRTYFRAEVHGMDRMPKGAALVVSNHSGGALATDLPVFAAEFVRMFGHERPFFVLAHDVLFKGPLGRTLRRCGLVPADRETAVELLRSGGVTMVFPGGDYDAARPFYAAHRIDFNGHLGYVRTALEAGVPIVPVVSIGGQETQVFLSRGRALIKRARLDRLLRAQALPVAFGFPFGFSVVFPVNVPLPSKLVTSVLQPIDLTEFGVQPDPSIVDAFVREVMQRELDRLARARRFPVIG
ncbi:MAG: lysophospholipid acyltransferase family protein [Aeromicrobium sp.]